MEKARSLERMKELFPIGKKYGKWIIVGEPYKSKRNRWTVMCNCECGRSDNMEIECDHLINGQRNKCKKCSRENKTGDKIKIGMKFGEWEVIEIGYKNNSRANCSLCRCSCGRTTKIIPNFQLTKGEHTSKCIKCSRNKIDLEIGQRFGSWTILETDIRTKHGQYGSRCICDCNRTKKVIPNTDLINGNTNKCKLCYNEAVDIEIKNGDKIGEWIVLEANTKNDKNELCSKVVCSCGRKEKNIKNSDIKKYPMCIQCANERKRLQINKGDKFGKWTVIETNIKNKSQIYCRVICDCGRTEQLVGNSRLINGKTTQCTLCSTGVIDVKVGDKYGKWTVIDTGFKDNNRGYKSLCKCDCGRTTDYVTNKSLTSGKSKECVPCSHNRYDLNIGDVYGNWTVIKANFHNNEKWSSLCRCKCGNERIMSNLSLVTKKSTKCKMCIDMTTDEYIKKLSTINSVLKLKDGEQYKGKYVRIYHICSNCKDEFLVDPTSALEGQKVCYNCRNLVTQSYMATALQQVLKYYYPNTICEYDIGFKGEMGAVSKYDIYVPELNLIIECQSGYHDSKKEFDEVKRQYAENKGYNFKTIDSRDYAPFDACKIILQDLSLNDFAKIVKWNNLSRRTWNLEHAQKLLNEGYSFKEVAIKVNATYGMITNAITRNLLIKPESYKSSNTPKPIIQLDLNYNIVNEYESITSTGHEKTSLVKACNGKKKNNSHFYKNYIWYFKEDYEKLNKEKDNTVA